MAKTSWMDDPRLARRLAGFTWVVLVTGFVLLTRSGLDPTVVRVALAGMIAAVGMLNAPVALGLWRSRGEAHTRAFRVVAVVLAVRLVTAGFVIWLLTPR